MMMITMIKILDFQVFASNSAHVDFQEKRSYLEGCSDDDDNRRQICMEKPNVKMFVSRIREQVVSICSWKFDLCKIHLL